MERAGPSTGQEKCAATANQRSFTGQESHRHEMLLFLLVTGTLNAGKNQVTIAS